VWSLSVVGVIENKQPPNMIIQYLQYIWASAAGGEGFSLLNYFHTWYRYSIDRCLIVLFFGTFFAIFGSFFSVGLPSIYLPIKTFSVQSLFWNAIPEFNIIPAGNDKYILRGWRYSFIIIITHFSIIIKLVYSFIIMVTIFAIYRAHCSVFKIQ